MSGQPREWTFLTNHARVLVIVAGNPEARLRDIAAEVGITERAAQIIVADLTQAGYLVKSRIGRRNNYAVVRGGRFRHHSQAHHSVDELLEIFSAG